MQSEQWLLLNQEFPGKVLADTTNRAATYHGAMRPAYPAPPTPPMAEMSRDLSQQFQPMMQLPLQEPHFEPDFHHHQQPPQQYPQFHEQHQQHQQHSQCQPQQCFQQQCFQPLPAQNQPHQQYEENQQPQLFSRSSYLTNNASEHLEQRTRLRDTPANKNSRATGAKEGHPQSHSQPTAGQWRLMWCFEHSFKESWRTQRLQLSELVRDLGGKLICLKSPRRLEDFLDGRGAVYSVVLVDWTEAQAFISLCSTLPTYQRPKYIVIRCERAATPEGTSARAEARAWLQSNPLPTGMKHFLTPSFDPSDHNLKDIMEKVSRLAAGHVEAKVSLRPRAGDAAGPANCRERGHEARSRSDSDVTSSMDHFAGLGPFKRVTTPPPGLELPAPQPSFEDYVGARVGFYQEARMDGELLSASQHANFSRKYRSPGDSYIEGQTYPAYDCDISPSSSCLRNAPLVPGPDTKVNVTVGDDLFQDTF